MNDASGTEDLIATSLKYHYILNKYFLPFARKLKCIVSQKGNEPSYIWPQNNQASISLNEVKCYRSIVLLANKPIQVSVIVEKIVI